MRILITGANGLLGFNLAMEAAKEHTVIAADKILPPNPGSLYTFQVDLLAPGVMETLLDRTQPDWVIHCAALANLEACEADPVLAAQLNSELPGKLAWHVARGGARLVHISTDSVFDGQRGGYSEEDQPNPLSLYARTKLDGERAVIEVNPDAAIARVNFYGWSLSGKRSLAEFFFNNLQAGKAIPGFTDVHFCPLLANDLALLLLSMLTKKIKGIYHVVSPESISKYKFGLGIARQFGFDKSLILPASISQASLTAVRSPLLTLRTDKLTRDLGVVIPKISTGLKHFFTLYQQGYPLLLQKLESNQSKFSL